MKLLISGGHPSPAYAVIDTLQLTHSDIEIVFVGRMIAQHATGQAAGEKEAMESRGIPFFAIKTAKWGRTFWQKLMAIGSVVVASTTAYRLLGQIKPDIFLSFGSYVAIPLALACSLRRIPIITHEQTRVAGISNRLIARLAKVVAISYPESAGFFPTKKTVLTGLPLRPQLFNPNAAVPKWVDGTFHSSTAPIVYVTGGSTGSHVINELISSMLPDLLKKYRVVHPCGKAHNHHDWPKRLRAEKQQLTPELRDHYVLLEQVSATELAWLYQQPLIVFGRAGANTAAEVAAFGLRAIFVPLPHSNYDEQHKNAQALVAAGQAIIIEQDQLNRTTLERNLEQSLQALKTGTPKLEPSAISAAETLINIVLHMNQNTK